MLYRTFPPGKIRGVNCGGIPDDDRYGPMKQYITEAKAIGCNMIRAADWNPDVLAGIFTMESHLNSIAKMVSYCQSLGMWFYGTFQAFAPLQSVTTDRQTVLDTIVNNLYLYCKTIGGFPNVFACDVINESDWTIINNGISSPGPPYEATKANYTFTTNQWQSYITQLFNTARAAAPNLALTYSSFGQDSSPWTSSAAGPGLIQFIAPLVDFLDQHIYYSAAPGNTSTAYTTPGISGKYLFTSECGKEYLAGAVARQTFLSNIWNNVVNAPISGQPGHSGICWYTVEDTNPNDLVYGVMGLYDEQVPPVLRADIGPQFANYPCQPPLFTTAFPKTGWGM